MPALEPKQDPILLRPQVVGLADMVVQTVVGLAAHVADDHVALGHCKYPELAEYRLRPITELREVGAILAAAASSSAQVAVVARVVGARW